MKFSYLILTTMVVVLSSSTTLEAKMYKWVDATGKVHYSDRKPAQKRVKAKAIKTIHSGSTLPSVEIKTPLPYKKSSPSQAIFFDSLEIKLPGANFSDVKIGRIFSGRSCSRKVGDLVWVKGNGIFDNARLNREFKKEFNRSGYRLVDKDSAMNYQSASRLILDAKLVNVRINTCSASANHSSLNSSDAYLKIKWELKDSVLGNTIFVGASEGVYKGISKPAREKGSEQSVDRAINIAINNILANPNFVKLISKPESQLAKQNRTDSIRVAIKYASNKGSFKSKVKTLKKSAVTVRVKNGHGSGVILSKDGYILTNAHVVHGAREVLVIVDDQELEATVIRTEPIRDVALLKLKKPQNLTISSLSLSKPEVGDTVFVIGTPISEALSHTVTSGIISAIRVKNSLPFYQTDAAINQGNSGGPVFNELGELIAISVSGLQTQSGAGLGLNYLIPIKDALDAINVSRIEGKVSNTQKGIRTKKENQTFVTYTTKHSTNKITGVTAFDLFQKAIIAKDRGQLDTAKGMLKRAIAKSKNSLADEVKEIRDELYYHLPIAYARKALRDKNAKLVDKILFPLSNYISNHPKRFAFTKEISEIRSATKYLNMATLIEKKSRGERDLGYVRIFMRDYWTMEGQLPASKSELSSLLAGEFGYRLSNNYDLDAYKHDENGFEIIFVNIKTNDRIKIESKL